MAETIITDGRTQEFKKERYVSFATRLRENMRPKLIYKINGRKKIFTRLMPRPALIQIILN